MTLSRLKPYKTTLVKYLNDILPVGKMVHRYDPKYPPSCPSCSAALEDRYHLWTCPAISRHQWRKDCQSNMLQALNKCDTAPPSQSLFLEVLDALLHGKPNESIPVDPTVAEVAEAQARIGWHQILKGRFVKEWKNAQDRYYRGQTRSSATAADLTHRMTSTENHQPDRMHGMNISADGNDSDDSWSTHAPTTPAHSPSPNPSLDSEEDTYSSEASTLSLSTLEVSDSRNQADLRDNNSISSSTMPILV